MPSHVKLLLIARRPRLHCCWTVAFQQASPAAQAQPRGAGGPFDSTITQNAQRMIEEGRRISRFPGRFA
jgi:hypothetical protein